MRNTARASLCMILSLGLICIFLPEVEAGIKEVYGSPTVLPSDGDAWTENNNATYMWKFRTSYTGAMAWITSDVKTGIYALNVTHTTAATSMYFRLVLDRNYDVSRYDVIAFWLKAVSSDTSYDFKLYFNPTDTNWDNVNKLTTPLSCNPSYRNNSWTRIVVPLSLFDASGTATLGQVKQIYFEVTSIGSADKSMFQIDNLRFMNYEVEAQTPTFDQTKMMPLAWHSMKFMQFQQTYQSRKYTSLYTMQSITSPYTNSTSPLEAEVLGQTIFALMIAYDKTGFPFYLDEAKMFADWMLNFQEKYGMGKGGFHNQWTGGAWQNEMGATQNGWVMAGLSYLYGKTGNSTYATASHYLRDYLTGIMWNSTNNVWNLQFHNATQTVTLYGTSYQAMPHGAICTGLATYYKYVLANQTVKDQLDKVLNKVLISTTWQQRMVFDTAKLEDNNYQLWGAYMAYLALQNATYKNAFLNTTKMIIAKYMQSPNLNGSLCRTFMMYLWVSQTVGDYLDDWGLQVVLPLLFLANEIEPQQYYVNLAERALFNYTRQLQNIHGAVRRDNSNYSNRQYGGSPSFIVAALQLYHLNKTTPLYVLTSTGRITAISQENWKITLMVNASTGATTTTKVYCGDKGEPKAVWAKNGSLFWSYDVSTKILTLEVAHFGPSEIIVDWRMLGDVNGDGVVDTNDLTRVAQAYGSTPSKPAWDEDTDLNRDYIVNILDLFTVGKNYGKESP